MIRLRLTARAKAVLGASLLLSAAGCDEDGKTAPARCAEPPLLIKDIAEAPAGHAGERTDGNPCVTPIGNAISPSSEIAGSTGTGGSAAGSSTGGTATGNNEGGTGGSDAGTGGTDAGAGGA